MSDTPTHRCFTFRLPAALEEIFGAALWEMGTAGLTLREHGTEVEIDAYFPVAAPSELGPTLADAWRAQGVALVAERTYGDEDWLAAYRARATPFPVGGRFGVDPRDPDDRAVAPAEDDGRLWLRIPAATAFGTGSHESTRLAVALLETSDLEGRDVLDVGTGSGILAFVALRLGARSATGFDLDLASVVEARRNARRNGLAPRLVAGRPAAFEAPARFDAVVVNILPERVRADVPAIAATLRPGGRVISSGNLAADADAVLATWAAAGLVPERAAVDGEWIAWVLRRESV